MSVMFVFECNWIVTLVRSFANTQIQQRGAMKKHTPLETTEKRLEITLELSLF